MESGLRTAPKSAQDEGALKSIRAGGSSLADILPAEAISLPSVKQEASPRKKIARVYSLGTEFGSSLQYRGWLSVTEAFTQSSSTRSKTHHAERSRLPTHAVPGKAT